MEAIKLYVPKLSEHIGGGWTFMRNLEEGLKDTVYFVDKVEDCDILFISGVTLVDLDEAQKAVDLKKSIVFRVDNIPKKSRNKRGRVYDKMRFFGAVADVVIYQSKWAEEYAYILSGPGEVIYNGVDQKIFKPGVIKTGGLRYLYVNANRDENKRFPEAAYHFHMLHRKDPSISLTIVGNFSPEFVDCNFDFFNNENVNFLGLIDDPKEMAKIYQDHDVLLFPAFADAAPNTVLEARACGLDIMLVNDIGGTKELLDPNLDISLERMAAEYYGLFQLLIKTNVY